MTPPPNILSSFGGGGVPITTNSSSQGLADYSNSTALISTSSTDFIVHPYSSPYHSAKDTNDCDQHFDYNAIVLNNEALLSPTFTNSNTYQNQHIASTNIR